jgi:transcriptional regulator with XRE-family HTH domain
MTFGQDPTPRTANEWARANVREAMDLRKWSQAELANRLDRSQPWLSKRLTGTTEFQIGDLDALATVFGLSPSELLQPGFGKWDRRKGERRSGTDRRGSGDARLHPELANVSPYKRHGT